VPNRVHRNNVKKLLNIIFQGTFHRGWWRTHRTIP